MYNRLFRIFPERIVKLTFFREIKYAARTYCKVRGGLQRGHSLHLGPLDPRPLHAEAGGQLGWVRQLLRYTVLKHFRHFAHFVSRYYTTMFVSYKM